jgi:hypothetical protein
MRHRKPEFVRTSESYKLVFFTPPMHKLSPFWATGSHQVGKNAAKLVLNHPFFQQTYFVAFLNSILLLLSGSELLNNLKIAILKEFDRLLSEKR